MKMKITEIKRIHKGHWFDRDTIRFFGTRFMDYVTDRHGMFITEEKVGPFTDETAFSVRLYVSSVDRVVTVGDFNGFETLEKARQFKRAVRKALDDAGNREKHVLERLVRADWDDEGSGFLVFESDDGAAFSVAVERAEIVG